MEKQNSKNPLPTSLEMNAHQLFDFIQAGPMKRSN